ncbi:hypothetical protein AHAS_Ahas15G0306500 [Arachis hypogaea]
MSNIFSRNSKNKFLSLKRFISLNNNNNSTRIAYLIFWRKILITLRKSLRMIKIFKTKFFKMKRMTKLSNSQRMIKKMR